MKMPWKIAPALLCVVVLTACGGGNELTWTEDVRLPDGRVLLLKRWVEFKGPHAMGDTATESKQRLEFKHPDTGEVVRWENAKEAGFMKTVAIWLDKGRPNLLGTPAYGDDSHKFSCPNPPYLMYEYMSGQWHAKPLDQISVKTIRANLTTHAKQMRGEIETSNGHLTAAQTSDSYTYREGVHKVPYIIKFEGMPAQTFDIKNCFLGPDVAKLILVEEK